MRKQVLKVPPGIRYISDWKDYKLPEGHCIVDKGVTGCGYTEFCLSNSDNVVLCSPRKLLLENKSEQHAGDRNLLYVKNDIKEFQDTHAFEDAIRDHILSNGYPGKLSGIKLLVTYDSTFRVAKVLKDLGVLNEFFFVTDEFQSIFLDSYFKASVELDFVEALQDCKNVIYLSATPMLGKYLDRLPEFQNLPFYELDWSETGIVEKIVIKRRFTRSLVTECYDIIQSYLQGKFEVTLSRNGKLVRSEEAVFYFNSISDITKVIKKANLKPSQVNIICADTQDNRGKISKLSTELLGKKSVNPERFRIGRIPLKGEPNKMFTFCTKTAYIGSDFHSDNARSFVFADPNISCLALDISLDLPQIAGRQRDIDNPFKNDITIFYRTIRGDKVLDKAEFDKLQKQRKTATEDLLCLFDTASKGQKTELLQKLKSDIKVSQYSRDYVSISKHTNLPAYNSLIELSNERAWEVSQVDYQDKINVTSALRSISNEVSLYLNENERIAQDFLDNQFYSTGVFHERMRMYCEFMDQHQGNREIEDVIYYKIQDDKFRRYYRFYGTSGCSAKKYREKNLYEGLLNTTKDQWLEASIHRSFKVGQRYTKKEIKSGLETIYRDLGITSSPKATDLGKYFSLTRTKIQKPDNPKKYSEGYRLGKL